MYKRYFILAVRHLNKHRLFSTIKILGLTIATASCLLIALYTYNELNYDKMHVKGNHIVKANMEYHFGGETVLANVCGNKVATAFAQDFPEIISGLRLIKYGQVIKTGDRLFEEDNLYFADSTFFSMLSFPVLGDKGGQLLSEPKQVVLSESTAKKYFGSENPIGQVLQIGTAKDYVVTAVMKDAPQNTHIKPDVLVSFMSLPNAKNETWWNANYATYFLLHEHTDLSALQARIPEYMKAHSEETGSSGDDYLTFHFEKFNDIHLRSMVPGNFEAAGNIKYIYILSFVGLLILLIACTTYINLTTATSTERSREIGVQKVMGVSRRHLITQNLMESGVIMAITVFLGFILAKFCLPFFNQLFDRQLDFNELLTPDKLLIAVFLILMVSFLSGIYPAIVISRYEPLNALRGYSNGEGRRPQWLKKSLIVFQFGISIVLTISALTLHHQMEYIKNKNLGFKRDQVISLPADRTVIERYDALKSQISNLPEVASMTISYDSPTEIKGGYSVGKDASGEDDRPVTALPSGLDFLQTMSIDLVAGHDFTLADVENYEKAEGDSSLVPSILINHSLAESWGWSDDEAVGKLVSFNRRRVQVKGVLNNFHFTSLHQPIEPLVLFPENWGRFLLVKLSTDNIASGLEQIKTVWSQIITHRPFNYHFLDEEFAEMYRFENQNARVTYVFTWLAILLACLGLFGVASYGFAQRTREIGIRKILGSSVPGIFALLAREYLILVLIALLIASPIAWMTMSRWLDQFAYRIQLQWWMILLAGFAAFIIAILTLSFQGIKAALMNPVESLKQD
jgi:putative ABC transport system permease protein